MSDNVIDIDRGKRVPDVLYQARGGVSDEIADLMDEGEPNRSIEIEWYDTPEGIAHRIEVAALDAEADDPEMLTWFAEQLIEIGESIKQGIRTIDG